MENKPFIVRRTFEAAKHPKGSEERARLNCNAVTSEYLTSYRYLVRKLFILSDGTPHPTQKYTEKCCRTKAEAETSLST